ncbi:MAG TPA: FTR1 family protein [Dermatophilaceae bacterium]|uniref:FTR1 family protein n=1 Tax=Candidatus Phosphoribacter hodrii TaxID=2953743 RepID=A0A9D7XWM2_9MICO|nr:FTR1 family protein [Candidatus Phosphoribacter hodrii]HOF37177.1 FTR1 family protein [Dermatophilaceae bacterium]HOR15541.1 FTR1 family protein [Dermatophilaceae bacterium]HOV00723.1 FTR1 family protein [Dermatophilaceae bacterium]HPK88799.1 FTR1 family protein [Dermatophilaceae bacterium]
MFFSNALIGLREGLEAALVVVILIAFLVKTDRRWALRYVWIGVGAAVALSVVIGAVLTFGTSGLDDRTAELVGGLASLLAVVLVTGMIFWMRSVGRRFAGELTGKLDRALDAGPFAIAAVAFLGVGREGLESALFFYATVESAGETGIAPALGWVVGIGAAVALGIAIYLGAVRIDLAQFFRWTGVGLVIVAAGILAYAVHELQEAGVLPGENVYAFDVRSTIDPTSPLATVVRGIFNLRPRMAVLEIGAWAAYLVVVLPLFLRGVGRRPTATAAAAAESVPAAKR